MERGDFISGEAWHKNKICVRCVMKKLLAFIIAVLMIFVLAGCAEKDEYLEQRCEELREEISVLEDEKAALENKIVDSKVENGTAKYIITFRIKQTHFTLDIGEHFKDSMNEITIEIPVDKEYYDSLSVGDTINDEFRMGSLIMHGSLGNWKVIVDDKEIR